MKQAASRGRAYIKDSMPPARRFLGFADRERTSQRPLARIRELS